jgi:hypothetical protein
MSIHWEYDVYTCPDSLALGPILIRFFVVPGDPRGDGEAAGAGAEQL